MSKHFEIVNKKKTYKRRPKEALKKSAKMCGIEHEQKMEGRTRKYVKKTSKIYHEDEILTSLFSKSVQKKILAEKREQSVTLKQYQQIFSNNQACIKYITCNQKIHNHTWFKGRKRGGDNPLPSSPREGV